MQEPKLEDKVTDSSKLVTKDDYSENYYQITMSSDTLDKFKSSDIDGNYQNIQIKLTPLSETEEAGKSYKQFISYSRYQGTQVQGVAEAINVFINSKTPNQSATNPDNTSWTIDGVAGYSIIEGVKDGETYEDWVKTWSNEDKKLKFSQINQNQSYVLVAPKDKLFQWPEISKKNLEIKCPTDSCSISVQTQ